ncbi:MAG: hypothetical protein P1P80_00045 [ANME-2 cluster archaeon]|nr:hypothetical protein [ANME-2 cluster archaeon]
MPSYPGAEMMSWPVGVVTIAGSIAVEQMDEGLEIPSYSLD